MKRFQFIFSVLFILLVSSLIQWRGFSTVKASPDIHQGNIILQGNNVTIIEGRFDINGSIMVEENAMLILRNAILNFTQVENYQFGITLGKASNGHPRLVMENATFNSGGYLFFITLEDNSSLSANEFTAETPAESVHLYAYDHSYVLVSNSNAPFAHINIFDNSSANITDSLLFQITAAGDAHISLSNGTLFYLYAAENSYMNVINSAVTISVQVHLDSANFSVVGLNPVFVKYWNPYGNHSISVTSQGWFPNLTLIDTDVKGWVFAFYGSSNVTMFDSELYSLVADDFAVVSLFDSAISMFIRSYSSSRFELFNTTTQTLNSQDDAVVHLVNSTCVIYQISHQSMVYVSWFLDVNVEDSIGQAVPSANVTAVYPNATLAESKLTDSNGWTRLTLMEKIMNFTGEYLFENYTIKATYDIYSDETSVNMTGNQQTTLTLEDFVIPELPSLLILPLFMIASLLTAVAYRKKRISRLK